MILEKDKLAKLLALSAASLFLGACNKSAETNSPDAAAGGDGAAAAAEIKCFGINECKGQSACDVEGSHVCGGQNDCAGKGWILVPEQECSDKGGTVV